MKTAQALKIAISLIDAKAFDIDQLIDENQKQYVSAQDDGQDTSEIQKRYGTLCDKRNELSEASRSVYALMSAISAE